MLPHPLIFSLFKGGARPAGMSSCCFLQSLSFSSLPLAVLAEETGSPARDFASSISVGLLNVLPHLRFLHVVVKSRGLEAAIGVPCVSRCITPRLAFSLGDVRLD